MNNKRNSYKNLILCLCIGLSFLIALSACEIKRTQPDNSQEQVSENAVIINKGFYLFHVLNNHGNLAEITGTKEALEHISARHSKRINTDLQECRGVSCYASAIQWTDNEIREIGDQLTELCQTNNSFKQIVPLLKEEGYYTLYEGSGDTTLLRSAWENAALGVNHVLEVYLKGIEPRYPAIDSISYQVDDPEFKRLVRNELNNVVQEHGDEDLLFFELPLYSALKALEINGRDEAARYEPLNRGLNTLPFEKIARVSWDAYPYSVILVPGQGPDRESVVLDPRGMARCKLALKRYKEGAAPFLVVSGGHVHPYKTPYCEAVQMKKYMVEELNVPQDVIFIEPHARHTTTNIRNTSRMIYRFGIPPEKPVLIVTDSRQNSYIHGKMGKRALNELGYLPYKHLKKLNDRESEFYPVESVLQADPFDILDP